MSDPNDRALRLTVEVREAPKPQEKPPAPLCPLGFAGGIEAPCRGSRCALWYGAGGVGATHGCCALMRWQRIYADPAKEA